MYLILYPSTECAALWLTGAERTGVGLFCVAVASGGSRVEMINYLLFA